MSALLAALTLALAPPLPVNPTLPPAISVMHDVTPIFCIPLPELPPVVTTPNVSMTTPNVVTPPPPPPTLTMGPVVISGRRADLGLTVAGFVSFQVQKIEVTATITVFDDYPPAFEGGEPGHQHRSVTSKPAVIEVVRPVLYYRWTDQAGHEGRGSLR